MANFSQKGYIYVSLFFFSRFNNLVPPLPQVFFPFLSFPLLSFSVSAERNILLTPKNHENIINWTDPVGLPRQMSVSTAGSPTAIERFMDRMRMSFDLSDGLKQGQKAVKGLERKALWPLALDHEHALERISRYWK